MQTRSMNIAAKVATTWRTNDKGHKDIRPIVVRIGRQELAGSHHVNFGDQECIYLVGRFPKSRRAYYRLPGDSRDWFLGAYYTGPQTEMQPFGCNVMLFPWAADSDIEAGSRREQPLPRMKVTIDYEGGIL